MLRCWDDVAIDLRVEATLALDEGDGAAPLLVAFAGEQPLALTLLRPFHGADALQALVEVLALLLPLGADRVALSLPGTGRPAAGGADPDADGAGPDADGGGGPDAVGRGGREENWPDDARPLVCFVTADVTGPSRLRAWLHPLRREDGRWCWAPDTVELDPATVPLADALGVLLARRHELRGPVTDPELQQQLARCLLLGHAIQLDPAVADRLEPDRLVDASRE